jgi:hypothetical protein
MSYVNWKLHVDGVWHNPNQNIARLNLATFAAYDIATAFYSYKGMNVPTNVNDEAVCGADQSLGWLGAPSGPAVCLAPGGTDLLGGGGVSVSADFTNRIHLMTGDMQMLKQGSGPYNLKISSSKDGRIVFRIKDIDISGCAYPELTCMVDILSEKSGFSLRKCTVSFSSGQWTARIMSSRNIACSPQTPTTRRTSFIFQTSEPTATSIWNSTLKAAAISSCAIPKSTTGNRLSTVSSPTGLSPGIHPATL